MKDVLNIDQICETFGSGYTGPDIYVELSDGSSPLVHENEYTLNWCIEQHLMGYKFYYDI